MKKIRQKFCKHKKTSINFGWVICLICDKYLYAVSTFRTKTYLDRDGSDTPTYTHREGRSK